MSTYPDAPGHRNVDTSIAAAIDLAPKLGRLQRLAECTMRHAGPRGLTADEVAARLQLDRWSIQPRTTELRRKGLIRDSDECSHVPKPAWLRFETSARGDFR